MPRRADPVCGAISAIEGVITATRSHGGCPRFRSYPCQPVTGSHQRKAGGSLLRVAANLFPNPLDDGLADFGGLRGSLEVGRARAAAAEEIGDGAMDCGGCRIELEVFEHHRRREDR